MIMYHLGPQLGVWIMQVSTFSSVLINRFHCSCILAHDTFEMYYYMAGHDDGTFQMYHKQECHKLAFYPQKPIIKYSSSLLVYIYTALLVVFSFVMMHGDNLT